MDAFVITLCDLRQHWRGEFGDKGSHSVVRDIMFAVHLYPGNADYCSDKLLGITFYETRNTHNVAFPN